MEETATHNTKVSDSAYSNSCNSQSQHSGSSKSRHSNSSGSSSGYCGHPSTLSSGNEPFPQPTLSKRSKDKDHKKKKQKTCTTSSVSSTPAPEAAPSRPSQAVSVSTSDNVAGSDCSISSGNNVALGGSGALGVGLGGATIPGPKNEALQIATISQTLNCIQKLKANEVPEVVPEEMEGQIASIEAPVVDKNEEQILSCLQIEQKIEATDPVEFCVVVSMHDGVVMHTSASLTQVLGFPKDMWLGRSFVDFLHASDRIPFASHITSGVAIPFSPTSGNTAQDNKNSFFCRLRCYRGLKSTGFGVTEKKVTYLPFHLNLAFRELEHSTTNLEGSLQTIILVVTAKRVQTIYKCSEETRVSPKFVTKHLPSCQLSFVDPEVVPHFGYLPQDMINHSVMDFYHPEDLPFLKEVYEAVMKEKGSLFRSKPYRFRTQNGDFVLLETEWSSFINPWTRKLEFVIGQHRVLKGPANPDVFAPPREDHMLQISEEVLKESKIIEEEIKCLLQKPISKTTESVRQQVSKRCKDLANFMDTLMDEITKPKLKLDLPQEETSFSERDSVMLGEISPHHDYYDSKSSSETPPSYNQLNYNENIQRFFESKPKTTVSDESSESKMEANQSLPSTDEEGKSVPVADSSLGSTTATNRKCRSPVNGSGSGSGSGFSGSGGVTGSAGSRGETSQTNTNSNCSYRPHHLTEALLYRHNEDMEKKMVQKHREQRSKGGDRENKIKKSNHEKFQEQCQGLKRSGSHSWEGEHFKATKHSHIVGNMCSKETVAVGLPTAGVGTTTVNNIEKQYIPVTNSRNITPVFQGSGSVNLWPPFSVSVTPFNHSQHCTTPGGYSSGSLNAQPPHLGNIIPVYYIPSQPSQQAGLIQSEVQSSSHASPPRIPTQLPLIPQQVPYVNGIPGLAYYPIHPVYGSPVVYPSMTMIQPTSVLPATPVNPHKMEKAETVHGGMPKFQRPASQATSVKAEPGSAMGSIASASVKRCMSECSKKELALFSPEGRTSPNVSQDETKPKVAHESSNTNNYSVMRDMEDDSCFSSFYSFLKTEKSDESMTSGPEDKNYSYEKKTEDNTWKAMDTEDRSCMVRAPPVLQEPPWLKQVSVTPDLVYRYQMHTRSLEDILDADRKSLMLTRQPILVNDQLSQFYIDMELEGLTTKLMLEEGLTTSSSSGDDSPGEAIITCPLNKNKKKRRSVEYGKVTIIFEENAPLPPPIEVK